MTSEQRNSSEGLVASGGNLRQNVLLAASGTIDTPETVKSSKIDITLSDTNSDAIEIKPTKKHFWQNVFNLRENLVKNKNTACVTNLTHKCDEKSLSRSCVIGSATSLSQRSKNQIETDKSNQSRQQNNDPHNLDDTGDCISELIGHIGLWQIVWVAFLILFQIPSAFHIFSFMFQAVERDFWCAVPAEMEPVMNLSLSDWRKMSQPNGACSIGKNLTHRLTHGFLSNQTNENDMEKCTRFVFDTDISETTIQSEWNVVCEDSTLLNVIEMCFLAGAAIGSLSSGSMSDEYGRRHTLMIVVALQAIIGTALALVKTLMPYMILRFALGFVSMSIVNISFVLTVEMVTGKWSSIIGTMDLQLVVSCPWFALLLFWHVLPESPRWLLAKGRIDELKKIIETAARWNKRTLPPNYEKLLLVPCEDDSSGSFLDLFKKEYRRTTLLLMVAWYALVLQYMAITLHIGEMGGNIYLTTVYAGIFECIAIIISIFTVTKYGIQKNIFYNIWLAGICLIYIACFPNAEWTLVVFLAMLGKSTTGVANAMIPAFTSFQYPPTLRTRAMGMTNFAAGFALITVPYIWLLKYIEPYLPPLLLGLCGLIGALVLFIIDDRTAIILAAERAPRKLQDNQQQLGPTPAWL